MSKLLRRTDRLCWKQFHVCKHISLFTCSKYASRAFGPQHVLYYFLKRTCRDLRKRTNSHHWFQMTKKKKHQMEKYALLISGCLFILLWARTVHKSVSKRPQTSGCRRLKQLCQRTSRAPACASHTGGAGSCDNFSAVRHNFLWWLNQPARRN